jgi:NADPH:quinone reductase-like Zn-dependent oxidoreductase
MRFAEIQVCGQPPVVVDRPGPMVGDGEVPVAVVAAPITPLDLLCASGTSYFGAPVVPYVPGVQGIGTVRGRTVWFPTSAGMHPGDGSMAEISVVPADSLVELPPTVDPVLMAAAGLSAVAAHQALVWRGALTAGEQVLILGAGGVVGQAAIQFARQAGARRVIAATRSPAGQTLAAELGADSVVPLDTDDIGELAARFAAACEGPLDLVLDPLFGVPAAAAAMTLRPGGRLVNLGGSSAETAPITSSLLRGKSLRLLGYTNNELTTEQRGDAITLVANRIAAGALTISHEIVPLHDIAGAWHRQATGTTTGRVVLTL